MASFTDEFSFDHPQNKGCGYTNRLLPLPKSDPGYSEVEKCFRKGWKHPKKKRPRIYSIFRIALPEQMLKPFHKYRAMVASTPGVAGKTSDPANEQLLFHGTTRCCLLGDDPRSTRLCSVPQCNLCCVIRSSFDVKKCGTKHRFKRFGKGIYATTCSSKADDYTANPKDTSKLRVLLLNRVIVGKAHRRQRNATSLTEPPCGYHSVVGEPGVDLNYEETVVYENDAIRPAYLIVYGDPPLMSNTKILRSVIKTLFNTPLAS
ncbi:ADP-ribosylation [Coprinellus micaceus]|uniref:ADP-ribosylation n=1 Tax=Coprinellus micaceus TaxID=71717 RepID=A0A4Y7TM57_COPMI|nr:ADP-ribosylation [Coprinellus micaceus]